MDGYFFILCLGFGGLLFMSLLGLGHHQVAGRGHAGAGHASHGSNSGAHHHAGGGRGPALKMKGPHSVKNHRPAGWLLGLLSPRVLFSLLLGFGAAGTLLHPLATRWPVFLLPLCAVLGAYVFEWYAVQPLWRLLFGFASKPARTLESIVLEEGKAVTNFDATGHGLIAVDLDGQVRQLLGSLVPEERTAGAGRVRAGDRLFIRAVDPQRNSCTVSRLN